MMNNIHFKHSILAVALTLTAAIPNAFAFDTDEINQSSYEKAFKALDTDNNAALSEAEASKSEFFNKKHFALADANHDGSLTEEEFTNYKSAVEKKNLKRVISDSTITSKIKAKLLKDEGLKSLKVSVETHKGIVILSGFVKTAEQITLTEKIATETEGVKSVKNRLELKKED
jgi:hyperosmotically inducible protein